MGRRRSAVFVFGTGEPLYSECPGKGNLPRKRGKRRRRRGGLGGGDADEPAAPVPVGR